MLSDAPRKDYVDYSAKLVSDEKESRSARPGSYQKAKTGALSLMLCLHQADLFCRMSVVRLRR